MENYELRDAFYKLRIVKILSVLCLLAGLTVGLKAQSTSVNFPTPISTNSIEGRIPARDVGDARLTSYYYRFDGSQGDIFVNVSARNFNGDIDVFVAEGLRPLTKITLYADSSVTETGRVIYLRKSEKLILRIEGRSPDDNEATFQIKFAGSFVAVEGGTNTEPALPEVKTSDQGGIRVNSVGTIIKPKPTPTPVETVAETPAEKPAETEKTEETAQSTLTITNNTPPEKTEAPESEPKPENTAANKAAKAPVRRTGRRPATRRNPVAAKPKAATPAQTPAAETTVASPKVNPLENVSLIVLKKDGTKVEFKMTEVFRFAMNNGVLTIITKDGKIHRHSILDIQKMTIE